MAKEQITIKPDQKDLAGLYAAFKNLDKEANTKLKTDVSAISAWSATKLVAAASGNPYPKQAEKVAQTIRANKDRVPSVTIGGTRAKFFGGAVAGQIVFGSEFGANPTSVNGRFPNGGRRFPMPSSGYTIFKTLKEIQPTITSRWQSAVDDVLKNWTKG